MAIKASIDIGSNSVLLLIAEVENDKVQKILVSESRITGLGRDLDQNGVFHPDSMADTYEALKEFRVFVEKKGLKLEEVVATATEASRVAQNAKSFYQKVLDEIGFDIKIINGKAEAHFSMRGVLQDESLIADEIVLMDIGGASTEFIRYNQQTNKIMTSISTPIGVVRGAAWMKEGDLFEVLAKKIAPYKKEMASFTTNQLVCVAGTMTSIANIKLGNNQYNEKLIQGFEMSRFDLENIYQKVRDYTDTDFFSAYPFLGKRSKTIKAGFIVAQFFSSLLSAQTLSVSTFGLRHGTILERNIAKEFLYHG